MAREKSWHLGEVLLAAALLVPTLAFSQQPPDPTSTQDPGSANPPAQTPDPGAGSGQSSPNPAGVDQGLFARALNGANPLNGENGPLHWGWLSVRSVSFQEFYGNVSLDDPTAGTLSQSQTSSQLTTAIVLSHAFGASHLSDLTLQYTPSLFITEGHVYTDAVNQNAGFDMTFPVNPRLSVQISDRFSYFGSQRYYSGLSLDANYSLGTVAQNNFLNGPGSVLYESLSGTISYLWSPLTKVSFAPTFGYQNASGAVDAQENTSALYEGGQVSITHSLSATQTIGISYTGEHANYTAGTGSTSTAPTNSTGWQQDFLANYGQQIGASWRVSAGLGVTSNTGTYSETGWAINAGATKSYQVMDFALNYSRGHQFNGYITGGSTDRVDLVNTIRWNHRFTTSTSVAYFRAASGPPPLASGEYATELASYRLTRSLSFTGSVAYNKQSGDSVFVLNGHSLLGTVGITWAPPVPTKY
ncbi:MAG TPA: hypothetical protein VGI46_16215 [Candidatus Acidoferrum sp.]|jgi:hypothetical protein